MTFCAPIFPCLMFHGILLPFFLHSSPTTAILSIILLTLSLTVATKVAFLLLQLEGNLALVDLFVVNQRIPPNI